MPTLKTRTFRSGNRGAVRLQGGRLPDGTELTIVRSGDVTTLSPAKLSTREMIRRLRELPGPDEIEVRDSDIFSERPGP